jgi:hypothetical protein
MGLDEDLLPNNARDAHNLGYAILRDQQKASKHGTELTKSLIEFLTLMSPNGQVNLVVDDLIRMMIGDDIADMLEVPPVSPEFEKEGSEIAKEFVGGWDNIEDRHMILREICKPLNQIVMTGMLRLMNKGEKIHFFIPPSLQGEWGVQSQSQ